MNKMIFLNVGWMKHYQGLEGDSIPGGGSHVDEHHDGCETKNFQPYEASMYGFARIKGRMNLELLEETIPLMGF